MRSVLHSQFRIECLSTTAEYEFVGVKYFKSEKNRETKNPLSVLAGSYLELTSFFRIIIGRKWPQTVLAAYSEIQVGTNWRCCQHDCLVPYRIFPKFQFSLALGLICGISRKPPAAKLKHVLMTFNPMSNVTSIARDICISKPFCTFLAKNWEKVSLSFSVLIDCQTWNFDRFSAQGT